MLRSIVLSSPPPPLRRSFQYYNVCMNDEFQIAIIHRKWLCIHKPYITRRNYSSPSVKHRLRIDETRVLEFFMDLRAFTVYMGYKTKKIDGGSRTCMDRFFSSLREWGGRKWRDVSPSVDVTTVDTVPDYSTPSKVVCKRKPQKKKYICRNAYTPIKMNVGFFLRLENQSRTHETTN